MLEQINQIGNQILFFDLSMGSFAPTKVPLIIAMLFATAISFTFYFRWINFRGFIHATRITLGLYDHKDDRGDVSHFRALTSALSATVGLGNIAGVAIAIRTGGPGAVFWMGACALFGMTTKFACCTLSQMYRKVNRDGSISGGPMYYLQYGLKELGPKMGKLGKILGITYGVFILFAAIGGGNMYQANQTVESFVNTFQLQGQAPLAIGLLIALFAGMVILGGIRRIGFATSRIVPFMIGIYMIACIAVLLVNFQEIPHAIALIFTKAFDTTALAGGILGVAVIGIQRATFSNEAGFGSASIIHAAAKTEEPVREGLVGLLEPFIDTIVVCMMTALVVVVTGTWSRSDLVGSQLGVTITSEAFKTVIPWFPYVLTMCIGLFAFSTILSWGYYGERGWLYLMEHFSEGFALKTLTIYRVIYVGAILIGATQPLSSVLDFADLCFFSIAFPNVIGMVILAPKIKAKLIDYWSRHKAGVFENTIIDAKSSD